MGAGGFFAGLLGGVGAEMIAQDEREYKRKLQELQNLREATEAMVKMPGVDPEVQRTGITALLESMVAGKEGGMRARGTKAQRTPLAEFIAQVKSLPTFAEPGRPPVPAMAGEAPVTGELPPPPKEVTGGEQLPPIPAKAEIPLMLPELPGIERKPGIFVSPEERTAEELRGKRQLWGAEFEQKQEEQRREIEAIRASTDLTPEEKRRTIAARLGTPSALGPVPHRLGTKAIQGSDLPEIAVLADGRPAKANASPDAWFELSYVGDKLVAAPSQPPTEARETEFEFFRKAYEAKFPKSTGDQIVAAYHRIRSEGTGGGLTAQQRNYRWLTEKLGVDPETALNISFPRVDEGPTSAQAIREIVAEYRRARGTAEMLGGTEPQVAASVARQFGLTVPQLRGILATYGKTALGRGGLQLKPVPPLGAETTTPLPEMLPPEALRTLREGVDTYFANGQVWTLRNGRPVKVR